MNIIRIILPSVLCVVTLAVPIFSEFNDLGLGARPVSMGNAFTAVSDDLNAVYYNPSGLAGLTENEFISGYSKLYVGLDDGSSLGWSFAGYAQPLGKYGTAALGYYSFSLAGDYTENTIVLSYARKASQRFWAGLNLKLLKQFIAQDGYTAMDPVFEYGRKDSVQGFAADLGVLYSAGGGISLGASILNLNSPDMGFLEESKVPMNARCGISYTDNEISTAVDIAMRSGQLKLYTGGEKWFFKKRFAVRAGLGIGSRQFRNLATGLGYSFNSLSMDYAFVFPVFGISDVYGSHRFSFMFKFGAWPKKKPKKIIEEKKEQAPEKKPKKIIEEKKEQPPEKKQEKLPAIKPPVKTPVKIKAPVKSKQPVEKPVEIKKKTGPQKHVVKKGDTLKKIAGVYYGDSNKWKIIYEANKDKIERGRPKTGATLIIPAVK